MTGLLALLPPAPTPTETTVTDDALHNTYGVISLDVELHRALDLDLVTIQGTLILTKVLAPGRYLCVQSSELVLQHNDHTII